MLPPAPNKKEPADDLRFPPTSVSSTDLPKYVTDGRSSGTPRNGEFTMKRAAIFLAGFALVCAPRSASAQATFITGFELGSLGEGFGTLNGGSGQSGHVPSGN